MLVGTIGVLGLNMPVILAAFADHEFGTGVGGYSLFNSLTRHRRADRRDPVGPSDRDAADPDAGELSCRVSA